MDNFDEVSERLNGSMSKRKTLFLNDKHSDMTQEDTYC